MSTFRRYVIVFALAAVAVSSGFLLWFSDHLIDILAAPNWCARALNAVERTGEVTEGYKQCTGLLLTQVKALAVNSHIALGTIALSLLVLVVIVIAQARMAGRGPGGLEIDLSGDPVVKAAKQVAEAADEEAEEIAGGKA